MNPHILTLQAIRFERYQGRPPLLNRPEEQNRLGQLLRASPLFFWPSLPVAAPSEAVRDATVNTLNLPRRLLLRVLSAAMRLWTRTLRIRLEPADAALLADVGRPTLILFWHNRLFVAAELYRRYRRPHATYGLVSASRDGAWLAAFFQLVGLRAVRGSSSRRGREAIAELTGRLRNGADAAITPDGPRGPIYSFKPGPAILVRRSRVRVLCIGMRFSSAWRLRSWDRFILPRPFSRVTVHCRMIEPGEIPDGFEECARDLRSVLLELNQEEAGGTGTSGGQAERTTPSV